MTMTIAKGFYPEFSRPGHVDQELDYPTSYYFLMLCDSGWFPEAKAHLTKSADIPM
jgi:hypothetical protein